MSHYDDDNDRDRSRRQRTRTETRRRVDDYYDETAYNNTRENIRSSALVKRRDSDSDTVEEVKREFSPGGGYYRETIIRKSGSRPVYKDDHYHDDDRSRVSSRKDDSYYAAGRRSGERSSKRDDRKGRRYDDYSDESSRSRSRTPDQKKERQKSMPEEALEALGLSGAFAALTGKKRSSSQNRRGQDGSKSGGRDSRDDPNHTKEQAVQALKAAVLSGAVEAILVRNEPGGLGGEKGKRILTAALTAGGVDGLVNHNKDPEKHKFVETVGSALAGVAASRVVNGPRSRSRGPARRGSADSYDSRRGPRTRSTSRARDALTGGALGAMATKVYDKVRSRSRGRDAPRGRSYSRDSYDSYDSRSPPRARSRSRSVLARGLSKVGLSSAADRVDPERRASRARSMSRDREESRYGDSYGRDRYQNYDVSSNPHDRALSQPQNFGPGGVEVDHDGRPIPYGHSRDPGREYDPDRPATYQPPEHYSLDYGPRHTGDPETDSDSDLGSSAEDEKMKKKSKHKMLVTGSLATVATIHAGNSVYQSIGKRQARQRAVRQGRISKEEAEQSKRKNQIQDAASIGLAALGLKGAYSEWKETKESREAMARAKETAARHARKREMRRRKSALLNSADHPYRTDGEYSTSMPSLGRAPGSGDDRHAGRYHNERDHAGPASATDEARNNVIYYDENPYGAFDHPPPPHAAPYEPGGYGYGQPPDPHNRFASPVPGGTGFPPPPIGTAGGMRGA